MYKALNIYSIVVAMSFAASCGGEAVKQSNSAVANQSANSVTSSTVAPTNLPPEFSGTEVKQPANAPGIPSNMQPLPKGSAPTPGIPSEADLKKPFKPGTTPTPGIPDPETIRKALNMRSTNVNLPPPDGKNPPMMKGNAPKGRKIQ